MIKTRNLILLIAVIAMGVLFTAPAVMAVWPEPPPIYDNLPMTATIEIPKSGTYTINVVVTNGLTCYDESANEVPCDEYRLNFTHSSGSVGGFHAVYLTTPRWLGDHPNQLPAESAYCSEVLKVFYTSNDWQRNQNTAVLWEIKGRDVMQWTNMTNDSWDFRANKIEVEDLVPGTICIEEGRYFRCAAIAVPDCPRPECGSPQPEGNANSQHVCTNNWGKPTVEGDEFHFWYYNTGDYKNCVDTSQTVEICSGLCPDEYSYETAGNCITLTKEEVQNHVNQGSLTPGTCADQGVTVTEFPNNPHYLVVFGTGADAYKCCMDLQDFGCDGLSYCQ